jgi:hypothetical protein
LHAHHVRHWAHGGATDLGNLVHLCSRHHRLVHEGAFTIEPVEPTDACGVRFRRPDGQVIPDVCPGARADGPAVEEQNRARGVAVGPDTCLPCYLGDPLDYDMAVGGLCWQAETAKRSNPPMQSGEPGEPGRPGEGGRCGEAGRCGESSESDGPSLPNPP